MPESNLNRLIGILNEIFMLDKEDLDFGIYRIMNVKRDEMKRFIADDLLKQVGETIAEVGDAQQAGAKQEYDEELARARQQGWDAEAAENVPAVRDKRERWKAAGDPTTTEQEVFSHLADFFRRYYKDGDFLSLRRYKKDVYAIPYEGEEVKLHWANADQYYIKSSEQFRDYAFKLEDSRRVHFKLASADTELNNNISASGQDRRFILCASDAVAVANDGTDGDELIIRFEYRPDGEGRRREAINAASHDAILAAAPADWRAALASKAPTPSDANRTLLAKHLNDYTAKNTFDYFIHKDLDGFLRRELDFYVKNEVMHLDDVESETAARVEQYLTKIKAIRRIAHKIIEMLAQLENFQKKLWLKKKFVVETNFFLTLDRVPEELYPEIAANEAQREEWVRLFAIDEIEGGPTQPAYSVPLTVEFLKSQPHMGVDTRLYTAAFIVTLLADQEGAEATTDGVLVRSENAAALRLLEARYAASIDCIHIDPPYNTQTSGFLYANGYEHSSWMTMIDERVRISAPFLTPAGSLLCHIDENEYERLQIVANEVGIPSAGTVVWDKRNPMLGRRGIATQHEYIIWRTNAQGPIFLRNANQRLIVDVAAAVVKRHEGVTKQAREEFAKWISNHPGLTAGDRANRYLDNDGRVYQSVGMGAPEPRQDPKFHIPLIHPVVHKPCPVPANGWSRAPETLQNLIAQNEIIFGKDETVQPRRKVFLTLESQRQVSSILQDPSRGKMDMDKLGLTFPYCHPVSLYVELVGASAPNLGTTILDYFAGSGTTAHAVINLNREDGGNRKYILVEMGEYVDTIMKPRIQKVIYSKDWDCGKPVSRQGSSHMFKYIRLESYEDTLNNLELRRTDEQQAALDLTEAQGAGGVREGYMLKYMLDVETTGSPSLLNIDMFEDPFNYTLNIAAGTAGETKPTRVDLVETFNYLIGLRVRTIDHLQGFRIVTGDSPAGEKVLVIWRNMKTHDSAALNAFFEKQKYNPRDNEYDLIYVNGDNNLENLKRDGETWKVNLIEEHFLKLMFDVKDV